MFKTLLKYFKANKNIFFLDIFCAIIVALIDLMFPLCSRYAMYKMLPAKMYERFFILMGTVGGFYIIRSLAYYTMVFWGHTFGVRVETDIREDLYAHMQKLDHDFYDRNRTAKLMSRLTSDLFELTELTHHGPEDLFISILTIAGSLFFMFRMDWRLTAIVASVIPVFMIIVMRERKNMSITSKNVKKRIADINSDIESTISGIRTSKAFANEDLDFKRFRNSNRDYRNARKEFFRAMGGFLASQEFFMCIMPVIIISCGGYYIMKGEMDYIDLITFTLFVNTFITPIRKMAAFAEVYSNGMAGFRRFMEVMEIEPSIIEKEDAKDLELKNGEIIFKDVSFAYPDNRDEDILRGINLDIRGGEYISIVGQSGGGKTTLCSLIPRFYEVSKGSISIDGQDIRSLKKNSLRKNTGIVQQDVFIFADTIYENIRYGRKDASKEEIIEAAKMAEIYDDIMEMPDGFNTYVGERGNRLSGGQKQRISIARIFLKNPGILILDEATSALDTITERKIQLSLERLQKGRTSIVIAHRLATVKNADRIILINNGEIVEEGSHEELISKNGEYAGLYKTQKLFPKK